MRELPQDSGWMGDRKRGASSGRVDRASPNNSHKFTLRKLRIDSSGYDSGGAYWGIGQPLYWACSDDGTAEMFFRAAHRVDAKFKVLDRYPGATFYR